MVPELDPFITNLVATLAQRLAHGLADGVHDAWSAVMRLVRRKLEADPRSAGAVRAFEREPGNPQHQTALAAAMQRARDDDAAFREQLRSLSQQVDVDVSMEQRTNVSQAVTVNVTTAPDRPSPGRLRPVPRQLPPVTVAFVNRTTELSGMDEALARSQPGSVVICVLSGMPGVGKLTTACHWAAKHRDRFPGGEVLVDYAGLRSRTGAGGAQSEAVGACLRALGVQDAFLPAELDERVKLLRTLSAGEPKLFVLRGVTEPEQVRLMLPTAPGSVVLVATQHNLGELVKDGARVIPVDPLDEQAALSLLRSVCGAARIDREPAAAEQVARLCAGHTDALRVAGARLALDPDLSMAELAGELADEARRLGALSLPGWASTGVDSTVAAAFAVSYQRLPRAAKELYRDLGVMPVHDLTDDLVRWVAGAEATATLERLVAANLVRRIGRGRYQVHRLIRLHAAHQAERESAGRAGEVVHRVIEYYRVHLGWADRMVMGEDRLRVADPDPAASGVANPFTAPDGGRGAKSAQAGKRIALAWLERERTNLLMVLRAARDAGLDEVVCQLAEALTAFYFNHRYHADWIEAARLGVQAARQLGRDDVVARLSSVVSRAYTDLGSFDQARAELERALAAVADVDDRRLLASVWEFRGRYLEYVDRGEAIKAYRTAIRINTEAGEARGAALVTYFLGACLGDAGRIEEALPLLDQARTALRELGDGRMVLRCSYSIGRAHLRAGSYAEARRELTAAADGFADDELWHYEAAAREALADLAAQTGDVTAARAALARALAIEDAVGGPGLARLRAKLAELN